MKLIDTLNRNSFRGGGDLGAIQSETMGFSDTLHPILSIGSDLGSFPGEDPRKRILYQDYYVDPDGNDSSTLRLVLRRYIVDETGTAVTSDTITINETEYTTDSSGYVIHNIDGDTYDTLHDFIDAINALPGFVCYIGDALTTHDMDTANFIEVAVGNAVKLPPIQGGATDALYRDVSEDQTAYVRIGAPRKVDMAPLQLIGLSGYANTASSAGLLVTDNMCEYNSDGTHIKTIKSFTPATSNTEIVDDDILHAGTHRGSWVLKVSATSGLTDASYLVQYRNKLGSAGLM